LRLVGVRATFFFLKLRATCRGSCRCFVRRSSAASSLAVSSPPRSELSSWVWREGDRGRFNLNPALFGILSRGARHWTKGSLLTCSCNKHKQSGTGRYLHTQSLEIVSPRSSEQHTTTSPHTQVRFDTSR
jgi:hypothetical protein